MVSIFPVPECAGCEEACEATVRRFPQHCCWRLTRDWPTQRSSSIVCHHMQRLPLWQGLLTAEENKFQLTYACTSPTLSNTEKYPSVADHLCPYLLAWCDCVCLFLYSLFEASLLQQATGWHLPTLARLISGSFTLWHI